MQLPELEPGYEAAMRRMYRDNAERSPAHTEQMMWDMHEQIRLLEAQQAQQLVYPDEVTPELSYVLGWPNFKCGPYAQGFREAGYDVPCKAEDEQAFVLHWLVKLVLRHGADWHVHGGKELMALKELVEQKSSVPPMPAAAEQS
jgi:hypothetical protein